MLQDIAVNRSFLSINHICVVTVVFDFDGTLEIKY